MCTVFIFSHFFGARIAQLVLKIVKSLYYAGIMVDAFAYITYYCRNYASIVGASLLIVLVACVDTWVKGCPLHLCFLTVAILYVA